MPRTKTTKKALKTPKDSVCTLTLYVFAKKIESTGSTPQEALENLTYTGIFPIKGILSMTKDGKTIEKIIGRVLGNRLFRPATREVAIKHLSLLFQGL